MKDRLNENESLEIVMELNNFRKQLLLNRHGCDVVGKDNKFNYLLSLLFIICVIFLPFKTSASPYVFNPDSLQLSFKQISSNSVIVDGTFDWGNTRHTRDVDYSVLDNNNNKIIQSQITDFIVSSTSTVETFSFQIDDAVLWNCEKPYLYEFSLTTGKQNGSLVADFGISFPEIKTNNFMLNEVPVTLRGINYQIEKGNNLTEELEKLKSLNINTIYVQDEIPDHYFLSKCDELGINLILDANYDTFRDDVKRITFHPSFLMWMVPGNMTLEQFTEMQKIDPHHPIIPIITPGSLITLPGSAFAVINPSLEDTNNLTMLNKPIFLISPIDENLDGIIRYTDYLFESNNIFGMTINRSENENTANKYFGQHNQFLIKQAYSPIKFSQNEKTINTGDRLIELELTNRYDFTNLQELSATWQLQYDSEIQFTQNVGFNLNPHESMKTVFPVQLSESFYDHETYLNILFEKGKEEIYRHAVWLKPQNWQKQLILRLDDLEYDPNWEVTADINKVIIDHKFYKYELASNPISSFMLLKEGNTRLITEGPALSIQNDPEESFIEEKTFNLVTNQRKINRLNGDIEIQNPIIIQDATSELINTNINMLASPYGYIDFQWFFESNNPDLSRASLEFILPSNLHRVSWSGFGPYPIQRGLENLLFQGVFNLDLAKRFEEGNRSHVRAITFLDKRNNGLGIIMFNGNIGISSTNSGTIVRINSFPSNAIGSLNSNEITFRLVPILRNNYPQWLHSISEN